MITGKLAAIYRNTGTHNEPVWEQIHPASVQPMNDGEALLAAILAAPGELTPRLVYADWLDENGQAERAEFIRVQCWLWANPSCGSCTGPEWSAGKPCQECDKREAYRERQRQLWNTHAEEWLPTCIGAELDHCDGFCRGFLEATWMSAEVWFKNAAEITAQHPIREVRLVTIPLSGPRSDNVPLTELWFAAKWPNIKFTLPAVTREQFDQITTDILTSARAAGRVSAIAANERFLQNFLNSRPASEIREYRADNVRIDPPTEQE